jgi:hypothetical protein
MTEPATSACVACRWQTISTVLKWIGGAVTVISLLVGVRTLTGIYQDWGERRDAVQELVNAADWLIKTQHYPQAWEMYTEARELSPSAPAVRAGQFELAKLWLRNFAEPGETAGKTLDRLTFWPTSPGRMCFARVTGKCPVSMWRSC